MFEIREYTESGRSFFGEWFADLDAVTAARVDKYIRRIEAGNFDAAKPLGAGLCELRLDFGPGYRVYYGRQGMSLIHPAWRWNQAGSRHRYRGRARSMEKVQEHGVIMPLTKHYKDTVVARIKSDPAFAAALFAEATHSFLTGEIAEALSILRDLVHARITFKTLADQTGFDQKALHRMLGRAGNPTVRNFGLITKTIAEDLSLDPRVTVAAKGRPQRNRRHVFERNLAPASAKPRKARPFFKG
jgi:putative addiction module killer protein